jgi:BRCT domain type II-containing protein
MATMVREDAQAEVERLGGVNAKSVTKTLDYLVVGDLGSPLYGNGKKGSKMLKAEEYQQKGMPVKIISETAFLQMLAGGAPQAADSDAMIAGCEVLWEMATGAGEESAPRRCARTRARGAAPRDERWQPG